MVGNLVARFFHSPPDPGTGCNAWHIQRDGFKRDVAIVFDGLQGGGDGLPINVIIARRPAICAASMDVTEVFACALDCFALMLLLDVRVKGIEMQFEIWTADVGDEFQSLIYGVEEVSFKAV